MKMHKAALAVGALLATSLIGIGAASAAPLPQKPDSGLDRVPIEQAQYYYGGRNYCWYYDGWHGPGWYWCGYAWRRGYGWGSPVWGWNNWAWRGPRYYGGGRRFYGGGHYGGGHYGHGGGHGRH